MMYGSGTSNTDTWQPPRDLLSSTPREVGLTGGGWVVRVFAILMVAGALGGGPLLYTAGVRGAARYQAMKNEGVEAEGVVTRTGRTGGDHPRRFVEYRLDDRNTVRRGRTVLRNGDPRRFEPGDRIEVAYLPSDPGPLWMPGYEPEGVPVVLSGIVPALLLFSAGLMEWVIRRQARLLENGRPAPGRVTGVEKARAGNHKVQRVSFDYTVLSGAVKKGRFDVQKNAPPVGSCLTIVYDPDRPERYGRYPFSLVRVDRG